MKNLIRVFVFLGIVAGQLALAAPVVPIDPNLEWTNWSRTLYYTIQPGANVFPVNAANPYKEPIATPTIGDSFRRAAETWTTDTADMWTLIEWNGQGAQPGPLITVRMSIPANQGAGIPEELQPPGSQSADNDAGLPGGGRGANVLAFFQPTNFDASGRVTTADIVYNRNAMWGIDNNGAPNVDLNYDPIILGLHEIGHALRLDHFTDPNDNTIGKNAATVDGSVMRPLSQSGTHNTNPTNPNNLSADFARNPAAIDIQAAKDAAITPEPATFSLVLAAICAGWRFRRNLVGQFSRSPGR